MRVLHIGKFWPPYAGGIERSMQTLCAGLAARGFEVDVVAHAAPGDVATRRFDEDGVRVTLAGCRGQFAYTPLSPGFPAALRAALARKPDVLHLHLPNPAAFWLLPSRTARAVPWVLHWHSDIPLAQAPGIVRVAYPLYRPFERAVLRRASCIITTTANYRDASAALRPWRDKTRVVPLGLADAPAPTSAVDGRELWPDHGLRVLAVGRLSHYKGFDVLLRAVAITPHVQLVLVGDGEEATALHALTQHLGIAHRVHFTGAADDTTRDAAYAAAEVFCLPSVARSEAFGMVLLEAMRAGLPVVSSDVAGSGMHDVLDGGRAGVLVPPGDPHALAATLAALAHDAPRRAALAAAGHARWREHFTLRAMVDGVADVYGEVTAAD